MKKNFGLPTVEQVKSSKIFREYGVGSAATDYAILLGLSIVSDPEWCGLAPEAEESYEEYRYRTSNWLTNTTNRKNRPIIMSSYYDLDEPIDQLFSTDANSRRIGIRVTVPYDQIKDECTNKRVVNGLIEADYGEYAEYLVGYGVADELEKELEKGNVYELEKEYTADSCRVFGRYSGDDVKSLDLKPFKPRSIKEYYYKCNKYVRYVVNNDYCNQYTALSDEKEYKDGQVVWLEVKPIVWLIDEEKNIAITKRIILSGLRLCDTPDYYGDFASSELKYYLNYYFAKEIVPSKVPNEIIEKDNIKIVNDKMQIALLLMEKLGISLSDINDYLNSSEEINNSEKPATLSMTPKNKTI